MLTLRQLTVFLLLVVCLKQNGCYNQSELELNFVFKDYLQRLDHQGLHFDMYTDICSKHHSGAIRMYSSVLYFKGRGRRMSDIAHIEDAVMEFWFRKEETRYYAHASFCKAGDIIPMKSDTAALEASFEMQVAGDSKYLYVGAERFKTVSTKVELREFPDRHKSLSFGMPSIMEIGAHKVNLDHRNVYQYAKDGDKLKMNCLEVGFERYLDEERPQQTQGYVAVRREPVKTAYNKPIRAQLVNRAPNPIKAQPLVPANHPVKPQAEQANAYATRRPVQGMNVFDRNKIFVDMYNLAPNRLHQML